ncbi:MAG: iron-sulfur cluster assembly scaffold protein [Planctomycetales bacterium]|nr:iron-sulfur cluster assembly scaffold protein [Planctomycetales bacterium]
MTPLTGKLLAHLQSPSNYGTLPACTHRAEACVACPDGVDKLSLQLRVGNGVIEDARFEADGCAWCRAAASLIIEQQLIQSDLKQVCALAQAQRDPDSTTTGNTLARLQRLANATVTVPPEREGCVSLALTALLKAVQSPLRDRDNSRHTK